MGRASRQSLASGAVPGLVMASRRPAKAEALRPAPCALRPAPCALKSYNAARPPFGCHQVPPARDFDANGQFNVARNGAWSNARKSSALHGVRTTVCVSAVVSFWRASG
jgi:hypothetical protein